VLFGAAAFVLGFPAFGADAGGLIAAIVSFGIALAVMMGRSAGWKLAAFLTAGGFLIAFAIAFLERAVEGTQGSHLGGAILSADRQGWPVIAAIVDRKLRMNLTILLNPYTLTAIAGAVAVVLLAGGPLRARLDSVASRQPGWKRGLPAAGWGALAAFLFNDSGAVPAIFITGAFIASGLIFVFAQPPGKAALENSSDS
jgi:hypothetical protein